MLVEGKNGIEAEVLLGTVSDISEAPPIYTFRVKFHRYVAEQFLRHRMFSLNAVSSRALTVPKMNAKIYADPAMPLFWGGQVKGMQPIEELNSKVAGLTPNKMLTPRDAWYEAMVAMQSVAQNMWNAGYHQQIPNRLTHAFQMAEYIVTMTDLENFMNLRLKDEAAQSEITELARVMQEAKQGYALQKPHEGYHLPYVTAEEKAELDIEDLKVLSSARCAIISYNNHNTDDMLSLEKATKIYNHLINDTNVHATPMEHQARVPTTAEYTAVMAMQDAINSWGEANGINMKMVKSCQYFANLNFWISNRYEMEAKWLEETV
jgi:hypothetical protein